MNKKIIILMAVISLFAGIQLYAQLPGFRVVGRDLVDRCGEKIVLRGINRMITWQDRQGNSFPEIARTGANVVRIVMGSGDNATNLDEWAQKCIDNKMIPMVENHEATGNWGGLQSVVDWWCRSDMVAAIQKHEQYILVNIANECGQAVTDAEFRSGYQSAVNKMRSSGIHVPLIIDASGYGQDINVLQNNGMYLIDQDPDHNLLFSIHFWSGWTSETKIITELEDSVAMGLPLIVGEFAEKYTGCGCCINYKRVMEYCEYYDIGWLAWSWGPGNSDCSDMDMTTNSTYNGLRGWGLEVAVTDPYSIANTARKTYFLENMSCNSAGTPAPDPNATNKPTPLPTASPLPGGELVLNGSFDDGTADWSLGQFEGGSGSMNVENGVLHISINSGGGDVWHVQLVQTGVNLVQGDTYDVSFDIRSSGNRTAYFKIGMSGGTYDVYNDEDLTLTSDWLNHTETFTMQLASDPVARIEFNIGLSNEDIYVDNISVKKGGSSTPVPAGTPVITSEPTDTPVSTPAPTDVVLDCSNAPAWNTNEVYQNPGMRVVYNNNLYENKWYSSGQNPEQNSGEFDVWTLIGSCGPGTPTAAPTGPPADTPVPGITLGDVNSDGGIDIIDALLIAQYYVGLNPANFDRESADVNCDGTIDIIDALLIAQYYVGLLPAFSC